MWTVSKGVTSRPLERQDRLYPEAVSRINATRITDQGTFQKTPLKKSSN